MPKFSDALWLNVSPALRRFDRPLLNTLSEQILLGEWQYLQTADEPTCLNTAVTLLHDYLKSCPRPMHLLGHSTGGLVGLLYARRYPERVRSLTLLSVGVHPTVDWQAHYYVQRQMLLVSREIVLRQTVYNLFGFQCPGTTQKLMQTLERDLISSLSPHSLYQRVSIPPGGVSVPLLVCGSQDDVAVDSNLLYGWLLWLKESDCLWQCPHGSHFFHYFHPQQVSDRIMDYWNSLSSPPQLSIDRQFIHLSI